MLLFVYYVLNLQNPKLEMSATVASLYSIIADLVRLAAKYLRLAITPANMALELKVGTGEF